jgi:hypothetical protein
MHSQTRVPDPEARQRHARNVQAACQQLEIFTTALDDLMDQLESEIRQQPSRGEPSFPADSVKKTL